MKTNTKRTLAAPILTLAFAGLCLALLGCATAKAADRHELAAASAGQTATIYVSDFELDAASIKSDATPLPPPPKLPGPLGNLLPPPPGAAKDPQKLARDLVDSMTKSLVKELTKAGINARRLAPGEAIPTSGCLVRGVFTNVNQGNQLERAVVGGGVGKTELQVLVDITDLAQGPPTQFHAVTNSASASSSKAPGAAPLIERHPASVAARFVMAGNDLNKNIKQTASKVAAEVVEQTKQTSSVATTR